MGVEIVSDETFEQVVLNAQLPVLVDFFAEWCGPCKAMAPALDQVAAEYSDTVKVVKLDVDKSRNISQTFRIRAMPTLVLFKDGQPAKRHQGALVQKSKLKEWLDAAIASPPDPVVPHTPARVSGWQLANGMDVVLIERKGTAEVTHALFHRFGSTDAPVDQPDLAHVVTRLIANVAAKAGDQLRCVTGQDVTMLYQQTVVGLLPDVMRRAADRLRGMIITDHEIAEEGRRIADEARSRPPIDPRMKTFKMIETALFAGHPYSVSVFDLGPTAENTTSAEVDRFLKARLAPQTTTLAISGDIDPELVRQLVDATYGTIPPLASLAPRRRPERLLSDAPPRLRLSSGTPNAYFQRRYAVPSYVTAAPRDAEALDVLATLIAQPKIGLPRALADNGLANNKVQSNYISANFDYGQIVIIVAASDAEMGDTEAAVDRYIATLRTQKVAASDIARATEAVLARAANANEENLYMRYGYAIAAGRAFLQMQGWRDAIANVTAEDVLRVAQAQLVSKNELTAWVMAEPILSGGEQAA